MTPECEDSPAGNRHEIVAVIKGRREGEVVSGFGEDEISESRSLLLTRIKDVPSNRAMTTR